MNYEAIIFDLDGTAIPNKPNGMPSNELIAAIRAAKPSLKLCAATDRPITNAASILQALDLSSPCVISAGIQIVDPKTNTILWEATLEPTSFQKVLDICTPYHYEILVRNELIGEGRRAAERTAEEHVNVVYIMGCADADVTRILEQLASVPDITAAGVRSWTHEGIDIHVTHQNATKEHAVTELLTLIGVSKEKSIGVGDANNDIHLFKAVGHKVAMGNVTDQLKSRADEICDTVDNAGLAALITKYS